MITIRRSSERGHADHGWLDTYHSFSFADYYDPEHMHFRSLRVLNEDRVSGGGGFATHPHHDMEIVTYVISGALKHRDSMGNAGVIAAGEVQRITAGTGIAHSEFNHSDDEPVHFLQIWIIPERKGLPPGYEQRSLDNGDGASALTLIASGSDGDGAMSINQDARIYRGTVRSGKELRHALAAGRHVWVQVIDGEIAVNGNELSAGDGAAVSQESDLTIGATSQAEFLLLDLA